MHVQDDVNLHILRMLEGTFWLDLAYINLKRKLLSEPLEKILKSSNLLRKSSGENTSVFCSSRY